MTCLTRSRLFLADNGEDAMALPPDGRVCAIDVEVLHAALHAGDAGTPALVFNLCQGVAPMLRADYVETFGADGATWNGSCAELADVRAYLGVTGLGDEAGVALSGLLSINGQQYSLQPAGRNRVRVQAVGLLAAGCGNPEADAPASADVDAWYDEEAPAGEMVGIDVLVLYPTATVKRGFSGDVAAVRAFIARERAATNDIFRNSGIAARVDIVDVRECPALTREDVTGLLYEVVQSSLDPATHQWSFARGPAWEAVRAARDEAGADVVVLLAAMGTQVPDNPFARVAGQASCIPEPARYDSSALDVAVFSMFATDGFVFAHELGHLLGGKHDRRTSPTRGGLSPAYDYAHGYVSETPPFVTVMGYEQGDHRRVPAFSSADKTWNGQPLGIPLGKPGASDVARLFRLSTRVVAAYRGGNTPRWPPVALATECRPETGGSIVVNGLGPYPQGAVVSVVGQARAGFSFAHWVVDGKTETTARALSVTMDRPRSLTAVFAPVPGPQPSLNGLGKARPDGVILSSPAGPQFTSGSEVVVSWHPGPAVAPRTIHTWVVDGHLLGPALTPLNFIIEQDHTVGVIPSAARIAIEQESAVAIEVDKLAGVLETGVDGQLNLTVSDRYGGLPRFGLNFALISAPDGTRLASARATTDFAGRARLPIHAGNLAGEVVVKVSSTEQPGVGAVVYGLLQSECLRVKTNPNEGLVEGKTPGAVAFQLRQSGVPVRGIDIELTLEDNDKPGLALRHARLTTDSDGVAVADFVGQARGAGLARLQARATLPGGSRVSASARLAVLPRSLQIRCEDKRAVTVGERIAPLSFLLEPLGAELAGVRAKLELDGGTTGIGLLEAETGLFGAGIGFAMLSPARAPGTARLTIRAADAPPLSVLIEAEPAGGES
ncbi:InlB B-repeat-containing protein [Chromobacterium vaccinii]|uniref:InlB B-repeat-containing protein n=1 Tax=Chromobacterium vaccinii TaxID=1108595 RepID=UPI003C743A9A